MRRVAENVRRRLRRPEASRWWATGLASLLLHSAGLYGMSLTNLSLPPKEEEPKVLQIALVQRGADPSKPAAEPPAAPEAEPEPTPKPQPQVAEVRPQPAPPQPVVTPPPMPLPVAPAPSPFSSRPKSFADFRQRRMSSFVSGKIPDPGGTPDGDRSSNRGTDKCVPAPGRKLDRLYLLYDSSGSMSGSLRGQALRCAQQYAKEAIDGGATVVVGNFARHASFIPPTTNMSDVSFALREDNDYRATVLPSTELYQFFDSSPDLRSDLVILSDGYIPNYRETLSSYRYFFDLNSDNRAYLYTLGTPGHPEVTAALRKLGFEIYIYRVI